MGLRPIYSPRTSQCPGIRTRPSLKTSPNKCFRGLSVHSWKKVDGGGIPSLPRAASSQLLRTCRFRAKISLSADPYMRPTNLHHSRAIDSIHVTRNENEGFSRTAANSTFLLNLKIWDNSTQQVALHLRSQSRFSHSKLILRRTALRRLVSENAGRKCIELAYIIVHYGTIPRSPQGRRLLSVSCH